mgnify:CR=1 FL=1
MKKLKAVAITISLITLISCEKSPIDPLANLADRTPCALDYESAMDEYEQGLSDGTIEQDTEPPRECQNLVVEPLVGEEVGVSIVMRNFSETQEEKMQEAVARIKIVINSVDFKDRVIAHTFNGERTFHNNDGLTNEEIYEKIMLGAETLLPEEDRELDVDVTMYYKNNSTVGYTYPNTKKTWVNSKFFNRYTYAEVAKNVVHEWTHKIGFGHSSKRTSSRPYSVPYGVGSIIEDLINQL